LRCLNEQQLKKYFTYRLLSFLLLFAAVHTAVAGTVVSKHPATIHVQKQEKTPDIDLTVPAEETNVDLTDCLPDLSLCNTQVSQVGSGQASRRIQGDKDLLLLHADDHTKTVKASSGDDIKFADSLTHIYLFLFPHHFFW